MRKPPITRDTSLRNRHLSPVSIMLDMNSIYVNVVRIGTRAFDEISSIGNKTVNGRRE